MKKLLFTLLSVQIFLACALFFLIQNNIIKVEQRMDLLHHYAWGNFLLLPIVLFIFLFIASLLGKKTPEKKKIK